MTINLESEEEAVRRRLRACCHYSLYYFVKVVLGYKDLSPTFHLPELNRFTDLLADGVRQQAVEFPRGHFKTTCFTIGGSIWFVLPMTEYERENGWRDLPPEWAVTKEMWQRIVKLHNQDLAILLAFENLDNGQIKIEEIKRHFEKNDMFRSLFPEIAYIGTESPWSTESLRIRRTPEGEMTGEATFTAIGVGGAAQSRHYDVVWVDDVVGVDALQSPTVMDNTIRWFGLMRGFLRGRALGIYSWEFLVSNRWAVHDLNATVRKNKSFVFHTRKVVEPGPDGELRPAFPERFTMELIEEIRNDPTMRPYDFRCQYMNTPMDDGSSAVTLSKIHKYKVNPINGMVECQTCGVSAFIGHMHRYLHYDPYTGKGVRTKSAPAIAVVGTIGGDNPHVFLLDSYTLRESYQKIFEKVIAYNDLYAPTCITFEDVGSQNMFAEHLTSMGRSKEFREAKHRPIPRIVPSATKNKSKEVRIRDFFLPIVEQGMFCCRLTDHDIVEQLSLFPQELNNGDYDLLDALAQGPAVWTFPAPPGDIAEEDEGIKMRLQEAIANYSHA